MSHAHVQREPFDDKVARLSHVLGNPRRRKVVRALAADAPRSVRELAEAVAGYNEPVDSVHLSLEQTHIPALAGAGAVMRTASGAVTTGAEFGEHTAFLDLIEQDRYSGV